MIEDKAKELGRLIGQSSEYQAVKRANDALGQDTAAVALLKQMETLRINAQQITIVGAYRNESSPLRQIDSHRRLARNAVKCEIVAKHVACAFVIVQSANENGRVFFVIHRVGNGNVVFPRVVARHGMVEFTAPCAA
jgi:cell fate (sporulation/competence/biofilm development) regulator YlbF (YheA/YmcA/DUF963 family)